MSFEIGSYIANRYHIIKLIGQGGMARVYLAEDPRFERQVAIKVLPKELMVDPTFRARFEREAKVIASLQHPAIVPVFDYGEDEGQPFFVMCYMEGGSLEDRLNAGPLPLHDIQKVISNIAPALDAAHKRNYIHRDLKPGNILFDNYGNAYISDFGIVKLTESSTAITSTSIIVGTPAYMSPEQGRGERDIDGRSDIYSLGVILFQMLSGELPYDAATPTGMIIRHINDPIPNILDSRPELSIEYQKIIEKLLAKMRDDRYSTCNELITALQLVNHNSGEVDIGKNLILNDSSRKIILTDYRQDKVAGGNKADSLSIHTIDYHKLNRTKKGSWILFGILGLIAVLVVGIIASGKMIVNPNGGDNVFYVGNTTPSPTVTRLFSPQPSTTTTPSPSNTNTATAIPSNTITPTGTQTRIPTQTMPPTSTNTPRSPNPPSSLYIDEQKFIATVYGQQDRCEILIRWHDNSTDEAGFYVGTGSFGSGVIVNIGGVRTMVGAGYSFAPNTTSAWIYIEYDGSPTGTSVEVTSFYYEESTTIFSLPENIYVSCDDW